MNCCTKENPCGYGEGDCDPNKGRADMTNVAQGSMIVVQNIGNPNINPFLIYIINEYK